MTTDLVGRRLGEFEVVRELGRGGMGVVFEAVQTSLNRKVALKVLGPGLGLTTRAVERFQREAEAAAKLHHTNIVPVYATGEAGGFHFYAMELIAGPSLDAVIRQLRATEADTKTALPANLATTGAYTPSATAPIPTSMSASSASGSSAERFDRAAAMLADVAEALAHAHSHGVTHRDIKPSNLLLSSDGRLSITDFGLARMLEQPGMTVTGEFVGTPAYMSPEQITAGRIPVDHRTDVYSLGATLYELLTLRPPFSADGRDRLLAMVIQKEPAAPRTVNPKVPRDLETICLKCLEKDPDRRYQTAKELADDLRRYVNRFAILAKRTGPFGRAKKWVKRNPALSAALAAVALALGAAGVFAWQAYEAQRQQAAEKKKQEEKELEEKRQQAIDRAILAAMSSQFTEADEALAEAERLAPDAAESRFVSGVINYYRGRTAEAKWNLEQACRLKPEWIAPRAFLAVVCNLTDEFEGYDHHLRIAATMTPRTADDFLFRGYAVGMLADPSALVEIEEALRRRPSILGQVIRAEVQVAVADDTDDWNRAEAAAAGLRSVAHLYPDTPVVRFNSLFAHCVAADTARIARRNEAARLALDRAKEDYDWSERFKTHPLAATNRYIYNRVKGDTRPFEEESRQLGRTNPGPAVINPYLASLFRDRRSNEGLKYINSLPDPNERELRLSRVFYLLDDGNREDARKECEAFDRAHPKGFYVYLSVSWYSLAGYPEKAQARAREARATRAVAGAYGTREEFFRLLLDYECHDLTENQLLASAERSRWNTLLARHAIAFRALGHRDTEKALDNLRIGIKNASLAFNGISWHEAIVARLENGSSPWTKSPKK